MQRKTILDRERLAARHKQEAPARNGDGKQQRAKKPRTLEAYQPFPVDALPAPIREYVRQAAAALCCDPAYVALPALTVAASLIGNTRTIRLKRGWEEPMILWTAVVGESGTLKSPAYAKAVAYLFRLQKRLRADYKQALARYQEQLEQHKAAKRRAKEGKGPDPGDPSEEPLLRRVICSDTTIEKLAEILEDNPRGTLVARDELSAWLGSFARYKAKGAGSDLPNWLEMFRAGTVIVDRKTGERRQLFVERAAVSVTGTIQPGVLMRALTPEHLEAGLPARLLPAMPVAPRKKWSETEVAPEVEAAYHDALDRLLALDFGCNGKGEKVPHALQLSPEAKEAWVEFYNWWAGEQASAEGELAAALSKLEAYAARFALLHHVVSSVGWREDDLVPIKVESVRAGIALCLWFAAEARRIYATLSETDEDRATRKLVEHIQARDGSISARELQRSNSRKYPSVEHAEAALEALAAAEVGFWDEAHPSPRGGHKVRRLTLQPTHDTSDTRPDEDGAAPAPAFDVRPDTCEPTLDFSREDRSSVGSVMRREVSGASEEDEGQGGGKREASVGPGGRVSDKHPDPQPDRGDAWEGS